MAGLNARSESFIDMLLRVSGRARAADLQGMSEDEAAALLQAYADSHPEMRLAFDGNVLSPAAPAPAAAPSAPTAVVPAEVPVPMPAVTSPQPIENMPPAVPAPPSAVPAPEESMPSAPWAFPETPVAPAAPSGSEGAIGIVGAEAAPPAESFPVPAEPAATGGEELPSWFYEESGATATAPAGETPTAPAHEAVFGAPSAPLHDAQASRDYGVPQPPAPGGFYGVPDAASPEYVPVSESLASEDNFVEPPTPSTIRAGGAEEYVPYEPGAVVSGEKMQWWWYLIAFFFWPIGGIAGYFIVRPHDPSGARNLLIFTAAYFLVSILLTIAAIALLLPLAAQSMPIPSP